MSRYLLQDTTIEKTMKVYKILDDLQKERDGTIERVLPPIATEDEEEEEDGEEAILQQGNSALM